MTSLKRKRRAGKEKAEIVLAGLKGAKVSTIRNRYGINQSRYYLWRDRFIDNIEKCFVSWYHYEERVINQALLWVRLNNTAILDQFFPMLFRTSNFRWKIIGKAQGATIPNVKGVKELKAIPAPLMSLKEQTEILRLLGLNNRPLSVLDEMGKQVVVNILKSETIRQSILKKAFSGQLVSQDPSDEPASVLLERIAKEKAEAAVKTQKVNTSKKKRVSRMTNK